MAAIADRLATGRSWVRGTSDCAACGHSIAWGDLVPIASYLTLKGQCRNCGARIPLRLWGSEFAGLTCAAAALTLADYPSSQIAATLFLLILLGLFLCDLQTMRLPDPLTGALAVAGIWVGSLWQGLATSVLTALAGVGAFWVLAAIYRMIRGRDGLGQGDVKMMAGLAAMAGPAGLPWVTLIAGLSALIVAQFRPRPQGYATAVPLGSHLAVAGAAVWCMKSLGLL